MNDNYAVKIIAHSVAPDGSFLVTFSLMYQRFIHAEFMTHRQFSRNAASSRAIPVEKMLKQVRENPAMPIHWGRNQPGMQANEQHDALIHNPHRPFKTEWTAEEAWRDAARLAAEWAEFMSKAGYHKQVVNRLLEPFQLMQTVMTTSTLDNWFALRDHPDAQPEIRMLARLMREVFEASTPRETHYGDWHLPYVKDDERTFYDLHELIAMSAARCARVSYLNHDGKPPDFDKDIELFERLTKAEPPHLSPVEHQAACMPMPNLESRMKYSGNFTGSWMQYRKIMEDTTGYESWMGDLSKMYHEKFAPPHVQ